VIICIFVTQKALYSSLEDGFKSIDQTLKYYKYLAIQSGPIEPSNNFERISWIVLILRSISHSCELWLCGDVNQTSVTYYDQYCKNVLSSMNHSFQISSPAQNNYKYNDNRHNLNMRETRYQNRRSESFRKSLDQNRRSKSFQEYVNQSRRSDSFQKYVNQSRKSESFRKYFDPNSSTKTNT